MGHVKPNNRLLSKFSMKNFWESLAAQTISGLIILAVASFVARATGLVSALQQMSLVIGLVGFVLIASLAFWAYNKSSTVRASIEASTDRRFLGRVWSSNLIFTGYKYGISAGLLASSICLGSLINWTAEIHKKQPDRTLVVYSAGLGLPHSPQQGAGSDVACYRKVIMVSNQTEASIVFTGASAVTAPDRSGKGLVDSQDITWILIGTVNAKASTGAMMLGPHQAALVSFASTDARVAEEMALDPASPLVEVREVDDLSFLTPALVRSAEEISTTACHPPAQVGRDNIPSAYQLYDQLYPRGSQ